MSHALTEEFRTHRDRLWGLCYRMTGSRSEAEDLVQDTFARALASPPPDTTRPLAPWLTTVATRLSIDALRRRTARGYTGPWLPEPVPMDAGDDAARLQAPLAATDAEVRYDTMQSATLAFLFAVEVLTPVQRAVLILRDVVGMTGPEVAAALEKSEANVRVALHRARAALQRHDAHQQPCTEQANAATVTAMQRFMGALASGDADAIAACLAADVRCVNDGGGVHRAALKPVQGPERVAALHLGLIRMGAVATQIVERRMNGRPAWLIELAPSGPRAAPRALTWVEVDHAGLVWELHTLLAPAKLEKLTSVTP